MTVHLRGDATATYIDIAPCWDPFRMKRALRRAGVSQFDVADELGIDRKTVSRQLNGHSRLMADVVLKVAELTGAEFSEFVQLGAHANMEGHTA